MSAYCSSLVKNPDSTMPEDHLAVQHTIFHEKMQKFIEVRPVLKYFSVRVKRIEHILDEESHTNNIDDTIEQVRRTSIAARKEAGYEILAVIRRTILDHADDYRHNGGSLSGDHIWTNIKAKPDIHPMSNLKRLYGKQKELLAMISSDVTAQGLIRYLDQSLLAQEIITAKDVLDDEHDLMQLDRRSERALNDLRMLKLA